jgi:curved DNA-binding protein CbpA
MNMDLFPYAPERDVYRLLQIQPEADTEDVIAACRRLARTFHPDRNDSPRAHEEMQVVNAIRRLLTDPVHRAAYDAARRRYLAEQVERHRNASHPGVDVGRRPMGPGWGLDPITTRLRRAWSSVLAESAPSRCPACHSMVEPDYRFCGACGSRLLSGVASGS